MSKVESERQSQAETDHVAPNLKRKAEQVEPGDDTGAGEENPQKRIRVASAEPLQESPQTLPFSSDATPSSQGELHPRLVKALSQEPYSALFGILWPTIVKQASYDTRKKLTKVSEYFHKLCRPFRRSDRAKRVRRAKFCFCVFALLKLDLCCVYGRHMLIILATATRSTGQGCLSFSN
jgi:hypothetical protein